MEHIGNYYLISHLTLFTGLSERTIRNYLSSGILKGEKINGIWHFSPEEVEQFIRHPAVRPSILAKQNATVYDFLLDDRKSSCEICMILDIPGKDRKEIAEYFCYRISNGSYQNIRFCFDGMAKVPRVILRGNGSDVMELVNTFFAG